MGNRHMQGKDLTGKDGTNDLRRERIERTKPPSEIEILPISFRQPMPEGRSIPWGRLLGLIILVVFCALGGAAWFLFTAKQVEIRIKPEPDEVSISGGWFAPRIGSYYLMQPGGYKVEASKDCYQTLQEPLRITEEQRQKHSFPMEKRPGYLTVQVHDAENPGVPIQGAGVRIDEQNAGVTPIKAMTVKPGNRRLHITTGNYQDLETVIDIEGCGKEQSINLALTPAWADVEISTIPKGGKLFVNEEPFGRTPTTLKLMPGANRLEIRANLFKTWHKEVMVKANQDQTIGPIHLQPADGRLLLKTNPSGANVTAGKGYMGKTPLEVSLGPHTSHQIKISKQGYKKSTKEIVLSPGEKKEIKMKLVPVKGRIHFNIDPYDAKLFINGKPLGKVPEILDLLAVPQRMVIQKDGYRPFKTTMTPKPGFPQELKITLKKKAKAPETKGSDAIKAANGYSLKLIRPGTFVMGASRREQGRRSNETLRKIILKKPFYMGTREVTNREFREFEAGHDSGAFARYSLNRDELPVVRVTWEQAALFCNWLSKKESLPLFYIRQGDRLVAPKPFGTGYRLPTEAEWEYCARFSNKGFVKYPWGNIYPPKEKSGNYADISVRDFLPNYLHSYNDGYAITAPTGAFATNVLGLYDLGGNVAEWCHDHYFIFPYSTGKSYRDPMGPEQGKHHVVKGAGWKDSSITSLRLSYRNYSSKNRSDLGFRICRYAGGVTGNE
jgi:formylglycine-generating enzyme required for sulfatase activity